MPATDRIRLIADRFVAWQTPYGRPDPKTCPFVSPQVFTSTHMHSPTFMALGLYKAWDLLGEAAWKAAADRYITWYFSCLRNPPEQPDEYARVYVAHRQTHGGITARRMKWARNILSWPFIYGMALDGYRAFRQHNPDEHALDSAASAVYEWLLYWRWDEGSYFRNGYGWPREGIVDAGNSDDICHMGRGLIGYHEVSGRADVLRDSERLAGYYLTEANPGTYDGCWSSEIGSWVVAPTSLGRFEHFEGVESRMMAWGFSSVGAIDYLSRLAESTADSSLRARIAEKCAASMRWHFDACQFDDGACGMSGRDDKWICQTAGAILSYLRTRETGLLTDADARDYRPRALAAREWLLSNITAESVDAGGYFPVTGRSEPRPPENQAWMLGWTLELLPQIDAI